MLKMKCLQVATLALAVVGFGLAPAGDVFASPCNNQRSSHDRWRSSSHVSYGSHDYHRRGFDSRTSVTYRNDNVRFSVSVGSSRSYHQPVYHHKPVYHQPVYHHEPYRHNTYRQKTVVHTTTHHQSSGYWKRVYHPPVYETRYQHCGAPYRVCISAGYYERVWVNSSYCP